MNDANPNINFIQGEIQKYLTEPNFKPSGIPKNNMETFPYQLWYQGDLQNSNRPTIMEREAGWNPTTFVKYEYGPFQLGAPPNHCWQISCQSKQKCHSDLKIKEVNKINI